MFCWCEWGISFPRSVIRQLQRPREVILQQGTKLNFFKDSSEVLVDMLMTRITEEFLLLSLLL